MIILAMSEILQICFPIIWNRLLIVTVNIFKEYLIVTVTIFKKYLIVTIVFLGRALIRYGGDIMKG